MENLQRTHSIKVHICIEMSMERYDWETNQIRQYDTFFQSESFSVIGKEKLKRKINSALAQCLVNFDNFVKLGSGWVLREVLAFHLQLMKFKLFSGACRIKILPQKLQRKKGLIFVENSNENNCFLLAITSALLKVKKKQEKIFQKI